MVCSSRIISSNVIFEASPILIPVLISNSNKAQSLINRECLKGDNKFTSISKQFSIFDTSFVVKVFGSCFSFLYLNFNFEKGENSIMLLNSKKHKNFLM